VTEHKGSFPQFYLTAPQPCPYVSGQLERKLFTHLSSDKTDALIDTLLKGGFRRSQNIAYMPYCEACSACVPVRIVVAEFVQRRSFRRIMKANRDLVTKHRPAIPTSEQYALFRAYIDSRHSDGGMADMSNLDYAMMVEDSLVDTFVSEYRLGDEDDGASAMAVALCDKLSDGISMVYSFFDPGMTERSLGTYMILEHIEYARQLGLPYVYLGYWIKGSRKMDYKMRYQPQEHLTTCGWIRS